MGGGGAFPGEIREKGDGEGGGGMGTGAGTGKSMPTCLSKLPFSKVLANYPLVSPRKNQSPRKTCTK